MEEVSHLFLSHQQLQGLGRNCCSNDADVFLSCLSHHTINSKSNEGFSLNDSAHDSGQGFARFQKLAEKNNEGFILLDQDKIVSLINPAAKFFLGIDDVELYGQLFNYFILEDEPVLVSIFRENRKAGVGEMHMKKTDWEGETSYLISIRDITDRLRTAEGKISFANG